MTLSWCAIGATSPDHEVADVQDGRPQLGPSVVVDAAAFARLSRELAEAGTTEHTIAHAVQFATRRLGTEFASVTIARSHGRFESISPTSDLVVRADQLQYSCGGGPGALAATESQVVTSEDVVADARWSQWGSQIVELGFRSALSAGLHVGGIPIGSLNLYGTRAAQFTPRDVQMAHVTATHASVALAAVQAVEGLQQALENRTMIGQAEGILMERFTVDDDQAFAILRRYSQNTNIKLAEIARRLVRTSALPTTVTGANSRPRCEI